MSWYGLAMLCNWLSETQGRTPVHDASITGWPANILNNGYHLPTEAQWERAAAGGIEKLSRYIANVRVDLNSNRAAPKLSLTATPLQYLWMGLWQP